MYLYIFLQQILSRCSSCIFKASSFASDAQTYFFSLKWGFFPFFLTFVSKARTASWADFKGGTKSIWKKFSKTLEWTLQFTGDGKKGDDKNESISRWASTFHVQWDKSLQVEKITIQQQQKSLFVLIDLFLLMLLCLHIANC